MDPRVSTKVASMFRFCSTTNLKNKTTQNKGKCTRVNLQKQGGTRTSLCQRRPLRCCPYRARATRRTYISFLFGNASEWKKGRTGTFQLKDAWNLPNPWTQEFRSKWPRCFDLVAQNTWKSKQPQTKDSVQGLTSKSKAARGQLIASLLVPAKTFAVLRVSCEGYSLNFYISRFCLELLRNGKKGEPELFNQMMETPESLYLSTSIYVG